MSSAALVSTNGFGSWFQARMSFFRAATLLAALRII